MTDEKMIAAIQKKDESVMNHIFKQYAKLLWKISHAVLHTVATEQDIEECVADVFVFLWMNPEKFDPQRGSLKSYLALLARSRALNRYRQLSRHSQISLEELPLADLQDPLDGVHAQENKQTLFQALATLQEPDREILIRRYYYNQMPKEIALALDLPVKQIDNRLYRTKRVLRHLLTE